MNPDLPPLLEFLDGRRVRTMDAWRDRRKEVRRLMIETFTGAFPDPPPKLIGAKVVAEREEPDGSVRRRVELTFDTPNQLSFEICLWMPKGEGPFPVLLTVPVEWQVDRNCLWPQAALKRGYAACLYPGVSFTCQPAKGYEAYKDALGAFRREYPEATMADLPGNAWIASRTLDYLLDPKYECPIAANQVCIIGHSRYGKQSLIAAAMDERIRAVVARSPGSPGSCPYRFTSRHTFAETPVDFPGDWFLTSLRAYYGREHELPIDAHGWLGLIAPRACLIHTAHNDGCEPTFAVERAYLEGREVYRFLGRPENLRVSYREGGHNPATEAQRMENFDWFDRAFGRGAPEARKFPEELLHHFDWQAWKAKQRVQDLGAPSSAPPVEGNVQGNEEDVRARILWALGESPGKMEWDGRRAFLTDEESELMTHDRWRVEETARAPVCFGENVRGNVYCNPAAKTPAPAVIWLHPYSYHSGYNEAYGVEGTTVYHRLAQKGFVVLAYDQCGFGLRLLEGRDFYDRHPRWSRLGRMVHDVRKAMDFLLDGEGASKGDLPKIDRRRVYALGYSLGGMVGLYAASLDERIAGVASFCGFTPLRTDTDAKPTGGIRRLWEWHALQPRLGLFHNREDEIPYDFDDVLSLIAPRACLIVSPKRDREADFEDVKACVARARQAWEARGSAAALTHLTPDDVNRFQAEQHEAFIRWFEALQTADGFDGGARAVREA
ncbi:MAG TPA: alpha/beta fold hydrolase [Sumerlaeia bacterium]|nr:alpha/beta fold hydrolase [Sumerlaeia bacterium]